MATNTDILVRTRNMPLAILIFLLFVLPQFAFAHHGGAEYDMTKTVVFKGKLTRVDMINPHSWIYFDVPEKDGTVSHHRCENAVGSRAATLGLDEREFPGGPTDHRGSLAQPDRSGFVLFADHRGSR